MDAQTSAPQPAAAPAGPQVGPSRPVKHGHRFLWIYLLVILLALAVGGVYAWQHQKVTDLNKQISNLDSRIGVTQNTQTNSASGFLVVKEWGVKIPLDKNTAGLSYKMIGQNTSLASFTTTSLTKIAGSCTTDSVLVSRGKYNDPVPTEGNVSYSQLFNKLIVKNQDSQHLPGLAKDSDEFVAVKLVDHFYVEPSKQGASCVSKDQVAKDRLLPTKEHDAEQAIVVTLNRMLEL